MEMIEGTPESLLARYRCVDNPNFPGYMLASMTDSQCIERRAYMRKRLMGTMYQNCTNAELDMMRIVDMGDGLYVEQDGICRWHRS